MWAAFAASFPSYGETVCHSQSGSHRSRPVRNFRSFDLLRVRSQTIFERRCDSDLAVVRRTLFWVLPINPLACCFVWITRGNVGVVFPPLCVYFGRCRSDLRLILRSSKAVGEIEEPFICLFTLGIESCDLLSHLSSSFERQPSPTKLLELRFRPCPCSLSRDHRMVPSHFFWNFLESRRFRVVRHCGIDLSSGWDFDAFEQKRKVIPIDIPDGCYPARGQSS